MQAQTKIKEMNKDLKENKLSVRFLSTSLGGQMLGIPAKLNIKLRYSDHYTHTHTSGAMQNWTIRGNSVFDPDYTYTGHQPSSFDELAAFYMFYRVKSSKIKVMVSSLTSDVPIMAIVVPARELTSPSYWYYAAENTRAVVKYVATTAIPVTELVSYASTSMMYEGQNPTDQDFGAEVSTNPTKVWFWRIFSNSANGASTSSCAISIEIEYDVEFSQKQFLNSS